MKSQRRSGVFIINFEQILNIVLVFPVLTVIKYTLELKIFSTNKLKIILALL